MLDKQARQRLKTLMEKQPFERPPDYENLVLQRLIEPVPGESDGMGGRNATGQFVVSRFAMNEMETYKSSRAALWKSRIQFTLVILTFLISLATLIIAHVLPLLGTLPTTP